MPSNKRVNKFDDAFPTLVRYAGLVSTLILIGFCLAGFTTRAAPGFVAAGGMILYKTVREAADRIDEDEERPNNGK